MSGPDVPAEGLAATWAGRGPLDGRVALITGASRRTGIGAAVAGRLAGMGADLFLQGWTEHDSDQPWGADPAGPDGVLTGLTRTGARVERVEADFLDPTAPGRLVAAAVAAYGHVDVLVGNHARSGLGGLGELTAAEIDAVLAVNVRASLLLVQAFAAQHDGRRGGRVVLLTSGQHLQPMPAELAYATSKGALHQVTASLADALADRGITVNTVNPGPTDTGYADQPTRRRVARMFPGGRWGQPDDAARLIAWLCSDDARWVTGQVIDSEGGFRRHR